MKNFKRLLSVSLCLFLFAGCGESFRGSQVNDDSQIKNDSTAQTGGSFGNNGFRNSSPNVKSQDMAVFQRYKTLLQGQEASVRNLTNTISGLDFNMTANSASDIVLNAEVTFDCNNSAILSRSVTWAELQTGISVSLGVINNIEVQVQCTDGICIELVTAIIRRDNFNPAAVLVGMSANSNSEKTIFYLSRNVNYYPYFAVFNTKAAYRERVNCPAPVAPAEEQTFRDSLIDLVQEEATERVIEGATDYLQRIVDQFR